MTTKPEKKFARQEEFTFGDFLLASIDHPISMKRMEELQSKFRILFALTLVRKHNAGEINIYGISTKEELLEWVNKVGQSKIEPIEIHLEKIIEKFSSMRLCVQHGDPESAVVILGALVEGEINSIIRIAMRTKNFSHNQITESIKGTNFRTKIEITLPLLGVTLSEQQRQILLQQLALRNELAHYKAEPELWFDTGTIDGSNKKLSSKVTEFFANNPIDMIELHLSPMLDRAILNLPHVHAAVQLFKLFDTQYTFPTKTTNPDTCSAPNPNI